IVAISIAIYVVDREGQRLIRGQSESRVLSIAATVAAEIDPEEFRQLINEGTESSRQFVEVREILARAVTANRRNDIVVKQIFAVHPTPEDKNTLLTAANPANKGEKGSHFGEPYRHREDQKFDFSKPNTFRQIVRDEWGRALAGIAPIQDK